MKLFARFFVLIPDWIQITNVLWLKLQGAVMEEICPREIQDSAGKKARKIMIEAGYL